MGLAWVLVLAAAARPLFDGCEVRRHGAVAAASCGATKAIVTDVAARLSDEDVRRQLDRFVQTFPAAGRKRTDGVLRAQGREHPVVQVRGEGSAKNPFEARMAIVRAGERLTRLVTCAEPAAPGGGRCEALVLDLAEKGAPPGTPMRP